MEYRILPHTDLKVSRLSFGTMPFGSQADQATATRMVDQCLDAGIHFFDTANMYNKGVAESFLGNALAGQRQRAGKGGAAPGMRPPLNAWEEYAHALLQANETSFVN